jgi:hypothetical protein
MKTIKYILAIALIYLSFSAIGDIGYCFKYKVRFELEDKSEIVGYYLFPTYDNFFKNISSFDTILSFSTNSWTDSIMIYKDIITIEKIRLEGKVYSINVIPENSPTKICLRKIIKTRIIEITPCCKKTLDNDDMQSYIGCCIAVINELSDAEIEILKKQEPEISFIYRDCPDDVLNSLVVLSYNKDLKKNDLSKKIKENYCEKANAPGGDYFEKYDIFKSWTREENIIVFKHCWW